MIHTTFTFKEKNTQVAVLFSLFFTKEKPSIPLLLEELCYVLIVQNYQPALNSSRLHCLRLLWLIQLFGAYFILGRKRLTQERKLM